MGRKIIAKFLEKIAMENKKTADGGKDDNQERQQYRAYDDQEPYDDWRWSDH